MLERYPLLVGMQRAFVRANFPDDSTCAEVAVGGAAHSHYHGAIGAGRQQPRRSLHANLVKECLFAARRSTLRAFATGHAGTPAPSPPPQTPVSTYRAAC